MLLEEGRFHTEKGGYHGSRGFRGRAAQPRVIAARTDGDKKLRGEVILEL